MFLSYRNQSVYLQNESINWFPYDEEIVNGLMKESRKER